LKPNEFWDLTPRELYELYEGYLERLQEQKQMVAWHISWVTSPHVKKPLKLKDILGTQRNNEIQFATEQQKLAYLRQKLLEERRKRKNGNN
jgi:hypothetical protein